MAAPMDRRKFLRGGAVAGLASLGGWTSIRNAEGAQSAAPRAPAVELPGRGDDLWLNWSPRNRAPPDVHGLELSEGSVFRTKTVRAIINVSDEYDDRIVEKYGGQTALDRIRDTGGRRRRSAQAN